MNQTIYLDYAASTPVDDDVLKSMLPYFQDKFYNPSANYLLAKNVNNDLKQARNQVASVLGARFQEIIFTAGGSEANNLAIHGIMKRFPDKHIISSYLEHDSVLSPIKEYDYSFAKVKSDGLIDLSSVESLIQDNTVLITLMIANNEIGTIQPIKQLMQIVERIRFFRLNNKNYLPLYVMADGCQATNYIDLHVSRLKVDMLTLNGSKIYGPKQSGILYLKHGVQIQPIINGGGQEFNLRSGTENMAGSVGFTTALLKAQSIKKDEVIRLRKLQDNFIKLVNQKLTGTFINGSLKHRLPNNVHLTFPGFDNERLLIELDNRGIMASAGSACSAASMKPSHVLSAIGMPDDLIRSSLRFTFGRSTTLLMLEQTIKELIDITKK